MEILLNMDPNVETLEKCVDTHTKVIKARLEALKQANKDGKLSDGLFYDCVATAVYRLSMAAVALEKVCRAFGTPWQFVDIDGNDITDPADITPPVEGVDQTDGGLS